MPEPLLTWARVVTGTSRPVQDAMDAAHGAVGQGLAVAAAYPSEAVRAVDAIRALPNEVERLHAALVGVLTEARAALAQQVGDEVVIPKASERLFAVHARAGAACYVCGDTIRSVWMGDRETSYCPTCQTGGRILATLTREMARRDARYGLETMCVGGGQGVAAIFERR